MHRPRLAPRAVIDWQPGAQLHVVRGTVMGVGGDGRFLCLDEVDAEGVTAVLDCVDGQRTLEEIVGSLERRFVASDVVALVDLLLDSVLRIVPSDPRPEHARVAVLGSGALARAIEGELRADAAFAPTLCESVGDVVASSPARFVVCALEDVEGASVLAVNDACLRQNVAVLFAAVEGQNVALGPFNVPWKTPCFACSRLSTLLLSKFDGEGPDLLPLLRFGSLDEHAGWLGQRVGAEVRAELRRACGVGGYPKYLGSVRTFGPEVDRLDRVSAVTTCPACAGLHRGQRLDATAATPPARIERPGSTVVDQVGGTRSTKPEEAIVRALAAADALSVRLELRPLSDSAPERLRSIGCPYFEVVAEPAFTPDAPLLFPNLNRHCYGKGVTVEQARCSAAFEWLERNLSRWSGNRTLLRASWEQVSGRAMNLPFMASGLLEGLPLRRTRPFHETEEIDWLWGHCLRRGEPILVPAALVYLDGGLFLGHGLQLPIPGSSGLSAGCTLGDAVLQGLLEVVERDAEHTSIRNALVLPAIDPDSVSDAPSRALLDRLEGAGYQVHLRDITTTFGVPVVELYVTCDDDYVHHFQMGYGAHLDPAVAMRRAITEAAQCLFFDVSNGNADPETSGASRFQIFPYRKQVLERRGDVRRASDLVSSSHAAAGPWEQVEHIVNRIGAVVPEADICFVDLTPPELDGVRVVRVLVTGMLDAVSEIQLHIPRRCRLVPIPDMFLGRLGG